MHSLYQESGSYQDSANAHANVMDLDMGACIYIRALGPRDTSQLTKSFKLPSNRDGW